MEHERNSAYRSCRLCPRRCGVDRTAAGVSGGLGYCGESAVPRLACASIHRGEEPPLTGGEGGGGSGTIFVSGCGLGCVFCQNYQITGHAPGTARGRPPGLERAAGAGRAVDTGEFARICLALRDRGAENINIVTGSHAVPAIVEGIAAARAGGLEIPVLWNSSAYELPGTLDLLADTVDLYLPDLKTLDREIARRYFNAPDYPEIAAAAIVRMMDRGPVMVRHLVLPGRLAATRDVLRWFADHRAGKAGGTRERRRGKGGKTWNLSARPGAALSLMFQYTPVFPPGAGQKGEAAPDRYIGKGEYEKVLGWLDEFGIEDGFCQELVPGGADWLPDFDKLNPFPSDLSAPVWHWKTGFIPVGQGGDFLLH